MQTKAKKHLSTDEQATLLLAIALLIGAWLRFTPALQAGFPINDGGMFYSMIGDVQNNHYALPAFTSFNQAEQIPFAYPPFPLYMGALLVTGFHVSVTQILLWLPAIICTTAVFAFYLLAKTLLDSRSQAALAALFFALTPRTFSWFLMGGGLTRSFGQLFLILTVTSALLLFTKHGNRYLILTTIFGAFTVLSHPEAGLHAAGIALLFWGFKAPNWKGLKAGGIVSLGVMIISAAWWLPVITRHGIAPLLNAAQTGNHSWRAWTSLLTFNFTEEPLLGLVAILGLLGLFASLGRRNYLFVLWFLLPYIVEPRSAPWIVTLPVTMLAAVACTDLILPGLTQLSSSGGAWLQHKIAPAFLAFTTIFSLLGSYAFALKLGDDHLVPTDQAAMAWIAANTPASARFIVITGAPDPMRDPIQEWFPALANRNSLTTLQGREWTFGKKFLASLPEYQNLGACIYQDLNCIQNQAQKMGLVFDSVYIQKQTAQGCPTGETCWAAQNLSNSLERSGKYKKIFENDSAVVFVEE